MTAPTDTDRPVWLTEDGWINPDLIGCPCCNGVPWCPEVAAEWTAEAMGAPELVMGTATYGRPR